MVILLCYVCISVFCNHCRPVKARGGEQNFRWNPRDVSGGMLNRKIEGHIKANPFKPPCCSFEGGG